MINSKEGVEGRHSQNKDKENNSTKREKKGGRKS